MRVCVCVCAQGGYLPYRAECTQRRYGQLLTHARGLTFHCIRFSTFQNINTNIGNGIYMSIVRSSGMVPANTALVNTGSGSLGCRKKY